MRQVQEAEWGKLHNLAAHFPALVPALVVRGWETLSKGAIPPLSRCKPGTRASGLLPQGNLSTQTGTCGPDLHMQICWVPLQQRFVHLADISDPGVACEAKRQLLKLLDISAPMPEGAPLVLRGRTLAHRLAVAEAIAAAGGPSEPEALVLLQEQPVLEVLSEHAPGMGLDRKLDLLDSQPEVRTHLGHLNLGVSLR